jgi:hypothetical protein
VEDLAEDVLACFLFLLPVGLLGEVLVGFGVGDILSLLGLPLLVAAAA